MSQLFKAILFLSLPLTLISCSQSPGFKDKATQQAYTYLEAVIFAGVPNTTYIYAQQTNLITQELLKRQDNNLEQVQDTYLQAIVPLLNSNVIEGRYNLPFYYDLTKVIHACNLTYAHITKISLQEFCQGVYAVSTLFGEEASKIATQVFIYEAQLYQQLGNQAPITHLEDKAPLFKQYFAQRQKQQQGESYSFAQLTSFPFNEQRISSHSPEFYTAQRNLINVVGLKLTN
ncbi:hypothetical protein [Psittacicella gerlachiana]|uniref:Uncharacterized protein n=1 Tax=Psittacicella gerlachiana TaxID=2028574 RepID=A0A3A1YF25_9GAMM|nr:hypothetical protein [Psittacicella gerlachiana]RIY34824.1 hypothetical protein CKF59_04665 [Psittacicella gerlachiana]